MSMSNSLENSTLLHYLQNADIANIGDAAGLQNSATEGSLYVSLHTGDPGEAGTQATSESAYTSYARVAVARNSGGWTVSTNTGSNAALVTWPACTGGSSTVTYFGIGTDSAGAGTLMFSGALTASLAISNGITPQAAIGALTITLD